MPVKLPNLTNEPRQLVTSPIRFDQFTSKISLRLRKLMNYHLISLINLLLKFELSWENLWTIIFLGLIHLLLKLAEGKGGLWTRILLSLIHSLPKLALGWGSLWTTILPDISILFLQPLKVSEQLKSITKFSFESRLEWTIQLIIQYENKVTTHWRLSSIIKNRQGSLTLRYIWCFVHFIQQPL